MQKFCQLILLAFFIVIVPAVNAQADQTIVFFRHGEKPSGGYGQLTCQGLNRALALPGVLQSMYGRPNYLYAPDPTVKIPDAAGSFYYVRPVATIEPAAIRFGMPVSTRYAYNDVATLQWALITPSKANTTIFVAWEHEYLVKVVQNIMSAYGGGARVPDWISGDYDSLYVLRVKYGSTTTASLQIQHEGLNGRSTSCP